MNTDLAKIQEYASEFSPPGFWEKLANYAKIIGCEGVRNALRLFFALEEPTLPPRVRAVIYGSLGYLVCPPDLIPDALPAVGYTDDLVVLAVAVGIAAAHITAEVKSKADAKLADWFGAGTC